jgi:hypothetical protein
MKRRVRFQESWVYCVWKKKSDIRRARREHDGDDTDKDMGSFDVVWAQGFERDPRICHWTMGGEAVDEYYRETHDKE